MQIRNRTCYEFPGWPGTDKWNCKDGVEEKERPNCFEDRDSKGHAFSKESSEGKGERAGDSKKVKHDAPVLAIDLRNLSQFPAKERGYLRWLFNEIGGANLLLLSLHFGNSLKVSENYTLELIEFRCILVEDSLLLRNRELRNEITVIAQDWVN